MTRSIFPAVAHRYLCTPRYDNMKYVDALGIHAACCRGPVSLQSAEMTASRLLATVLRKFVALPHEPHAILHTDVPETIYLLLRASVNGQLLLACW